MYVCARRNTTSTLLTTEIAPNIVQTKQKWENISTVCHTLHKFHARKPFSLRGDGQTWLLGQNRSIKWPQNCNKGAVYAPTIDLSPKQKHVLPFPSNISKQRLRMNLVIFKKKNTRQIMCKEGRYYFTHQ